VILLQAWLYANHPLIIFFPLLVNYSNLMILMDLHRGLHSLARKIEMPQRFQRSCGVKVGGRGHHVFLPSNPAVHQETIDA